MENKVENPLAKGMPEAPKLDLSKIKNLDALNVKGDAKFVQEIEKKQKNNAVKNAKSKFNFTEEYDIQLPSKGKFYQDEDDENIKKGIITVRPMSVAEEELMSNQTYIKNGSMFRRVFDSVITNDFEAKKLIAYDSLYLMYALRNVSYGDDYTIELKCPECDKTFTHTFNISEVPFDEIEDDVEEKRVIKLPVSKYTVSMRISRLQDDEELERMKKANPEVSETILGYIIKTDEIFDDNDEPLDPKDWEDFFTALPVKDRTQISKAFAKDGKAPTIRVVCPKCGTEEEYGIPFQSDFFRSSF